MKNADKRNNMAPSTSPSFKAVGNSVPPILSTAKLRAANVPGDDAFLMGLMNFSNSSVTSQHLPKSRYLYAN